MPDFTPEPQAERDAEADSTEGMQPPREVFLSGPNAGQPVDPEPPAEPRDSHHPHLCSSRCPCKKQPEPDTDRDHLSIVERVLAEPEPLPGLAQARSDAAAAAGRQVWHDLKAQALTVTYDRDARRFDAERQGELLAFAKWHGEHLRVFLPGGTFIGRLYRSDGRMVAGEPVYTYRADTGSDPLQHHPGEREVARRASMPDAVQALLTALTEDTRAEDHCPACTSQCALYPSCKTQPETPRVGTTYSEPLSSRLRRARDRQPIDPDPLTHLAGDPYVRPAQQVVNEPEPAATAAYEVVMKGQPHIRPVGWFSYSPPQAGEAFDKALAAARRSARGSGKRHDVRHTEHGRTSFCVGIVPDGALIWR
jgi:hypothetical protein